METNRINTEQETKTEKSINDRRNKKGIKNNNRKCRKHTGQYRIQGTIWIRKICNENNELKKKIEIALENKENNKKKDQ